MTHYADMAPLTHFRRWEPLLTAIGWLDPVAPLDRGELEEPVFAALVALCVDPWQPAVHAGRHACPFCRFTGGPSQVAYRGTTVPIGANNVFVPGDGTVFVAPTMVLHSIDAHGYMPPLAFQQAVMTCPPMKSMGYLREIEARGLVVTPRPSPGS